jgi:hypothetical protein
MIITTVMDSTIAMMSFWRLDLGAEDGGGDAGAGLGAARERRRMLADAHGVGVGGMLFCGFGSG